MKSRLQVKRYAEIEGGWGEHISPEEKAFHNAIEENPHDKMAPLAYADWLDEHNKPALATLLRQNIEEHEQKVAHFQQQHKERGGPRGMIDSPRGLIEQGEFIPPPVVHMYHSPSGFTNDDTYGYVGYASQHPYSSEKRDDLVQVLLNSIHNPNTRFNISAWLPRDKSAEVIRSLPNEGVLVTGVTREPKSEGDNREAEYAKEVMKHFERKNQLPSPQEYNRKSRLSLKKLARTESLEQHEKAVANKPHDATGWLALADHYDENDEPGGDILREYAKRVQSGETKEGRHLFYAFNPPHWAAHPNIYGDIWRSRWATQYNEHLTENPRFIIRSMRPHSELAGPGVVLSMNTPHAGLVHVPVNMKNVDKLAAAMGPDGEILKRVALKHFGPLDEPPEQMKRKKFSAYRAPTGGVVARGTYYAPGSFVPDMKGQFMNPPKRQGINTKRLAKLRASLAKRKIQKSS